MSANSGSFTVTATMTNAEFQALVQFISNTMDAGGLTATADTGQINTASAAFPGSNNTYAGYQIRTFTDSLQATAPVYFKIEYGRGGGANMFALQMTWGTGSNGSGTITGTFSGGSAFQVRLVESTTTFTNCYVSAGTCRFGVAFQTATALQSLFAFERTINASKVYTADGINVFPYRTGQITGPRHIPYTGTQPTAESLGNCFPPQNQTTGLNSNGDVAVYPQMFYGIGKTFVPWTMAVGVFTTDFTIHNTYTVNVLGTNQTMIRLALDAGGSAYMQRGNNPTAANFTGMMRYD